MASHPGAERQLLNTICSHLGPRCHQENEKTYQRILKTDSAPPFQDLMMDVGHYDLTVVSTFSSAQLLPPGWREFAWKIREV